MGSRLFGRYGARVRRLFLLTRARGTPYLRLEPNDYPEIRRRPAPDRRAHRKHRA